MYAAFCEVFKYSGGIHLVAVIIVKDFRSIYNISLLQVYCWEGVHSVKVDRDAALTVACRLSEETNAQLVKASQGREPPHLLQIYDGKLKILAGRHRDSRKMSLC